MTATPELDRQQLEKLDTASLIELILEMRQVIADKKTAPQETKTREVNMDHRAHNPKVPGSSPGPATVQDLIPNRTR